MQPMLTELYDTSIAPYLDGELAAPVALEQGRSIVTGYMLGNTRQNDLMMFAELANAAPFEANVDVPLSILLPAYITSELKTAFQIGFLIFLPFLVIDMVIASILMALGMMMLSPMLVSLPFKLLLFVLVDGWALMMGSLASSFMGS
jgi:flagellar biosynthetic protein FliP